MRTIGDGRLDTSEDVTSRRSLFSLVRATVSIPAPVFRRGGLQPLAFPTERPAMKLARVLETVR
jgi:hypothetical protein